MTQITKEEYLKRLKEFINTQMANIQAGRSRNDLKFWVKFNQDKEVEFRHILHLKILKL